MRCLSLLIYSEPIGSESCRRGIFPTGELLNIVVVAILILLVMSAFFSAAETAFTSLSFLQIKELESDSSRSAKLAAKLGNSSELLLSTVLVGNNIANLSASALVASYATNRWGSSSLGVATGVITLLVLIFGELMPKQIALRYNIIVVKVFAFPLRLITWLLFPVVIILKQLSSLLSRLFSEKETKLLSIDSLKHVVDVAEDEGIVAEYETSLVQRVLYFGSASVKSIMTHRTDVFSLSEELTVENAFPMIVASGYSRIPLYGETLEDITAILLLRDLLNAIVEQNMKATIGSLAVKPIFVPETRKLDAMFFQFKEEKQQIAVVLDEYGGLSGIVSLEDIIEQLFGEIYDEHESGANERIHEVEEGFIIQGDTSMQEVKDELELEMEKVDPSCSVAAYLIERLGTIPGEGEVVEASFGTFTILQMRGKRIVEVLFRMTSGDQEHFH